MDEKCAHDPNGTLNNKEVKEKDSATPPRVTIDNLDGTKKTITITARDRFLQGLQGAAKEKGLTLNQYIRETLENSLIREGHLPEWWHSRQF